MSCRGATVSREWGEAAPSFGKGLVRSFGRGAAFLAGGKTFCGAGAIGTVAGGTGTGLIEGMA